LVDILKSAGIELDKWASNQKELLPSSTHGVTDNTLKAIEDDGVIKTLGICWHSRQDAFKFNTQNLKTLTEARTKRTILSNIARLFDPLGWLSPVTVSAKVLMQDLCILKTDWDASLPPEMTRRWIEYCESLEALPDITIDRWLGTSQPQTLQIHGFCDASSRAYAAAVYLRVENTNESVSVHLIASKSKVAPIKSVSIPNLELCGAVLLVQLVIRLLKLALYEKLPVFLWSDSQIVLAWLNKHPSHWKTFVANRVSLIQTELPLATWSHVPTKENPADLATRGVKPIALANNNLWWHGPSWLQLGSIHWPKTKSEVQGLQVHMGKPEPDLIKRYSSLTRLTRITAWCLRPIRKLRLKGVREKSLPNFLTTSDLSRSRASLIRLVQKHAFATEMALLEVGRLSGSALPLDHRHPPILPRDSSYSRLLVRSMHLASLHGGPSLTASFVNQHAWILGSRLLVKSVVKHCVICQRTKPLLAHQLMGDLPASRVTPSRPFTTSGLDYAGPFQVRTTKGRGHRSYKAYIALFVCFVTRALHLELVSDLTTSAFIAAFRRFTSRRGLCRHLYSDNATTFKGADSELKGMFKAASTFYNKVGATLANDGTSWTFIPPNTPHYGGLWEAGVKSVKHHLRRAFHTHMLTFEEFSTALAEIEACLNSRPLCPLGSDPEDLNVLTPQHLQERGKWRVTTDNVRIGQLVLLRDDRYPPAKWPLGRITEVHASRDGLVRVVTVKTATNTLRRHVARICILSLEGPPAGGAT
jgi:hypothetical protein